MTVDGKLLAVFLFSNSHPFSSLNFFLASGFGGLEDMEPVALSVGNGAY